jgi:hypothetical protein
MMNARLSDELTKRSRSAPVDGFLQDPAGLKALGELADKLRTPRYRPVTVFELVGRICACHLEATPAGADDDPEGFGKSVLLAWNPGCSMSASETDIQVRRSPAL